jgi:Demerecviridae HNH endonuclease
MSPKPNEYAGIKFPDRAIVAEYLSYNPDTGLFIWKKSASNKRMTGKIAGSFQLIGKGERIIISIFGQRHPASHIAWLLMTGEWPAGIIDHKNNIGTDNRWSNLRPATDTQNRINSRLRENNTSGYRGVSRSKTGQYWVAVIGVKNRYIGTFYTREAAARAYDDEAVKRYGEFARLNFPKDTQR